ncbi:MAG: RcpC/CpaB family pilus assembly protein, partial [Armatimonadota bacterium]|nr:RcpC/CpaB family pilus assembly protein [Armatimonadota bacterium]
MRLNPLARIGLVIVVICSVLLGLRWLFGRLNPAPSTPPSQSGGEAGGTSNAVTTAERPRRGGAWRAREDIPERSLLAPVMFEEADLAGDDEADLGYVTDLDDEVSGYITAVPISRGTILRRDHLLGHITQLSVAGMVRPTFRAMVVPITGKSGYGVLHDLVVPNDYVDVIASVDQQEARTIVQGVRVLAVDVFGSAYPERSVAMWGGYKANREGRAAQRAPGAAGQGAPPSGPATTP